MDKSFIADSCSNGDFWAPACHSIHRGLQAVGHRPGFLSKFHKETMATNPS